MTTARETTARLADLLRREHVAMADFIVALAEFDGGGLWRDLGYSGLFSFLHRELGMSKAGAYYRKTAAELVQNFPEIIEPLRDGRLCITAVVELAKVITAENRYDVLPRFFHCSKREAKEVSAAIAPETAPPRREVTTRAEAPALRRDQSHAGPGLPQRWVQPGELTLGEPLAGSVPTATAATPEPSISPTPAPASSRVRDTAEPLTADLRRLHVTVSARFLAKLERAKAALSHSHPGASADVVLEVALDLLLDRAARKKGLVAKPRTEPRESAPDHVPAHVKRAVWERDDGRCQWPLDSGGICGSTARVEIDHVVPRALGGPSTVDNTRILCRYHNDLAARRVFGERWMDRFTRGRQQQRVEPPASVSRPPAAAADHCPAG